MRIFASLCIICSTCLTYSMDNRPETRYRFIALRNNLQKYIVYALYKRPDPGFLGNHFLVHEKKKLKGNGAMEDIMILQRRDGSSHLQIIIKKKERDEYLGITIPSGMHRCEITEKYIPEKNIKQFIVRPF